MAQTKALLRKGLMAAIPIALVLSACSATQPAGSVQETGAAPETVAGSEIVRLDPGLDSLIAPDARIERIATGYVFVEAPLWRNGELWFSDLRGNTLNAIGADGRPRVLMQRAGGLDVLPPDAYQGPNGMATDRDGSVLLAQHGVRRIVRLSDRFEPTPVIERFEGKRLNSPNDMVFHPDGSLWFTDPPYGLIGQDQSPAKEMPFNGVYRRTDGQLQAVIRDLPRPNGIAFSPDGRVLYVANSGPDMFVMRYDVGANGAVSNGRRFTDFAQASGGGVPDGLKVDSQGNVWATGPGGVRILSPDGRQLGQIRLPEVAANLAFGGPDLKTLYVTATSGVYRVPVLVAGDRPVYPR